MTLVGVPLPSICRSTPGVHRRPGSSTHPEPIPHRQPDAHQEVVKSSRAAQWVQAIEDSGEDEERIPLTVRGVEAIERLIGVAERRENLSGEVRGGSSALRFARRARAECSSHGRCRPARAHALPELRKEQRASLGHLDGDARTSRPRPAASPSPSCAMPRIQCACTNGGLAVEHEVRLAEEPARNRQAEHAAHRVRGG